MLKHLLLVVEVNFHLYCKSSLFWQSSIVFKEREGSKKHTMQKDEESLRWLWLWLWLGRFQWQCPKKLSCRLCLTLWLGYGSIVCTPASAQQPVDSDSAEETEKRFRWTTTSKVYLRYGGIRPPQPTNLFGFRRGLDDYEEGFLMDSEGNPRTLTNREIDLLSLPDETRNLLSLKNEEREQRLLSEDESKHFFQSYNAPSLETDDIGLDLYELLLGFEASSAQGKKWQGKARATLDVFELGARLSDNDWGGRLVEADDFDSFGVREAFLSLAGKKAGELRIGITEGVVRRLDAGASEINAGNGFFGDVSRTPWHIQQLGWQLGSAASDNFPKVQYLTPKLGSISIGAEWFSNLRTPDNNLRSFSRDSSSLCFPSLFYTKDKKLFELKKGNTKFRLYNNREKPLTEDNLGQGDTVNYYLLKNLPPGIDKVGCWQISPTGSMWHEDARPSIMGGNVAVAYEKDFPEKKLSLKFTARYGVRSSEAEAVESNDILENLFVSNVPDVQKEASLQINHKASQLEQAVGFSMGLNWYDNGFFGGVTYQFPASIHLENVGGEAISEKGAEALLWSVGFKTAQLIPLKKDDNGKRKKKGAFSVSFTQAMTKDPRYKEAEQEKTFLLNVQSLYPITKNLTLVLDYYYGEAAVSVPFFVTTRAYPSQGVLFFERRLVPSHEIVVGLKMAF